MPRIKAETLADHRELTRHALLDALDQLLSERSYHQISLADIAARAGVSRTTIYNYTSDKATLLVEAVADLVAALAAEVNVVAEDNSLTAAGRMTQVIALLLGAFTGGARRIFILQNQLDTTRATRTTATPGPRRDLRHSLETIVTAGIDSGEFRPTDDLTLDLDLLGGLLDVGVRRVAEGTPRDLAVRHVSDLVLGSLRAIDRVETP